MIVGLAYLSLRIFAQGSVTPRAKIPPESPSFSAFRAMNSHTSLNVFSALLTAAIVSACGSPEPPDTPEGSIPQAASTTNSETIVVERTPEPTPTPDRLTRFVDEFGQSIGADQVIFLGLTGTDWLNLGISWLIILASYGIGGIVARVIMPRLTRRVPQPYDRELRDVVSPKMRQLFGLFGLWFTTQRTRFSRLNPSALIFEWSPI